MKSRIAVWTTKEAQEEIKEVKADADVKVKAAEAKIEEVKADADVKVKAAQKETKAAEAKAEALTKRMDNFSKAVNYLTNIGRPQDIQKAMKDDQYLSQVLREAGVSC